eukprot:scaffold68699_cov19-Tisochrysis_lutea.AAC.1
MEIAVVSTQYESRKRNTRYKEGIGWKAVLCRMRLSRCPTLPCCFQDFPNSKGGDDTYCVHVNRDHLTPHCTPPDHSLYPLTNPCLPRQGGPGGRGWRGGLGQ